jgi:hypothetical protein
LQNLSQSLLLQNEIPLLLLLFHLYPVNNYLLCLALF